PCAEQEAGRGHHFERDRQAHRGLQRSGFGEPDERGGDLDRPAQQEGYHYGRGQRCHRPGHCGPRGAIAAGQRLQEADRLPRGRPRHRGHLAALPRPGEQGDAGAERPGQGPHLVHPRGGPEPGVLGHAEGEDLGGLGRPRGGAAGLRHWPGDHR
ncbi:unnamed protein product, partial [Effrenium voratum]